MTQIFEIPDRGERVRVNSGMGGVFIVRVTEVSGETFKGKIDMPLNPDWHKKPFSAKLTDIIEVL